MSLRAPAFRVLTAGAVPLCVLASAFHAGLIGAVAFQAGLTALLALGSALVLAGGARRGASRRGWLVVGAAVSVGMAGNALGGWQPLGLGTPEWLRAAPAAAAFVLSITGVVLVLAARPTRLPVGAALDGMTGALVAQAIVAGLLVQPVMQDSRTGLDVLTLAFPLAEVLLLGLVAAGVAHGGWRADSWLLALLGLLAIAVGDSAAVAGGLAGELRHGWVADLGWAAGTWLLAVAAWSPEPRAAPEHWVRAPVPTALGAAALAILLAVALAPRTAHLPLVLAAGALALVVARLALTLRANAAMLSAATADASTDALTGLGNRRRLLADLQAALAGATPEAPAAVALFDLNGFKDYNDTFGHPAGDALLAGLASELAGAVEGVGTAYRMGGDEFCVLFRCAPGEQAAIAAHAARALSTEVRGFPVTAAHGVVLVPTEARTPGDALRRADLRMYEDKAGTRLGSRRQVAQALVHAIEERDHDLYGHGEHVSELASRVAVALGLSDADVEAVRLAAELHDVGKLAVPDRILEKRGPFDDRERAFMRRHTLVGQRILEGAPALRDVALLVRSSHEHVDGTGYPDGLAGEDVPVGSRIIAVCNAFDAMTRERPHRPAMSREEALAELRRCAGAQFDARVVAALCAVLDAPPRALAA